MICRSCFNPQVMALMWGGSRAQTKTTSFHLDMATMGVGGTVKSLETIPAFLKNMHTLERSLAQLRIEDYVHQVGPPGELFRPGESIPGTHTRSDVSATVTDHSWVPPLLSSSIHGETITVIDVPQTSGVLRLPTPRALKS